MNYNPLYYPYPSRRMVVYGRRGMVAASQPLAAQAGLDMLKKGGNAVDAAIAAAACLTVVEPTSNGIGGDAFALVWSKGRLYGLNSSGPAPKSISIEDIKRKGYNEMPKYGWEPVTVPGTPAAWAELSKKLGRLPLSECLKPAIGYAEDGYPVSPVASRYWKIAYERYIKSLKGEQFRHWFDVFTPGGRAPEPGETWRSQDHANTLQSIAETGAESFYRGEIAERIHGFSKQYGGYLRRTDLESYVPQWVDPICVNYRGYDVWEMPPNGHGLVVLMALNILKGFEFTERDKAETFHRQIEAMKLAFIDGRNYITDPQRMKVKVENLLSESYGNERRKLIGREAIMPQAGSPASGGTVYLAAADGEGNMISYIQSNFWDFGSGLVVPGTGIALHNRGSSFSLDPSHVNCLEPYKKTYHTIIPGFLTKAGKPVGPFGVMGAFMQPQGHVQVVMNTVDFKLNPQASLDAPRWQWMGDKNVEVEPEFPEHIIQSLAESGHNITYSHDTGSFGRGQIIWVNDEGILCAGTEPRTDGMAAVW